MVVPISQVELLNQVDTDWDLYKKRPVVALPALFISSDRRPHQRKSIGRHKRPMMQNIHHDFRVM